MTPTGPSPAQRSRARAQLVVAPLMGGTLGVVAGLFLLWAGGDAVVPGWPFLLCGIALVLYALLVGRRLVDGPAPPDGR